MERRSVTHVLGLRAFGSPLLTEQIIGRGLRRTNYDVLNQPLDERPEGYEETADAFGIPFVGFPVQKRKRPRQYYPDFIVVARDGEGREAFWLAETKGEIRPNTQLKARRRACGARR